VDIVSSLELLVRHYDDPFGDTSALPTFLISKIARHHVKMVLSGDGGDEVQSGYPMHLSEKVNRLLGRIPLPVRSGLGRALTGTMSVAVVQARVPRIAGRIDGLLARSQMDLPGRIEMHQVGLPQVSRMMLLASDNQVRPVRSFIEETLTPVSQRDHMTQMNHWLFRSYLGDAMLCKVDRASMAHGLEVRAPFLDHRLVEFLASVSMSIKLRGFTTKSLLRKAFGQRIVPEALRARKSGFNLPFGLFFLGNVMEVLEQQAKSLLQSELFQPRVLKATIVDLGRSGEAGARSLWQLAILANVLRQGSGKDMR